jgi:hypothetical protein
MQYVNRTKLLAEMASRGMKRKQLAQELCITPSNLTLKIKGERVFNEREIACINALFGAGVFVFDYGKQE